MSDREYVKQYYRVNPPKFWRRVVLWLTRYNLRAK